MSIKKKDKEKSKKAGKNSPDKKALKKSSTKPSAAGASKKNAAKTSKSVTAKKAKPVVKKTASKVAKPTKSNPVKAVKGGPKAAVKNNPKGVAKKVVPVKKTVPTKVESKKAYPKGVSSLSKDSKSISKEKPVNKINGTKITEIKGKTPVVTAPVTKKEAQVATEKSKKVEALTPAATKKQLAEKKSNDVLAITNTIPVKAKHEISASKIASISHSITNPIKKTDSYAIKPEKEPSGKFELEFVVHSSAEMLYEFLSTPSGLSEWFCDDLNIRNGIYTFIWEDQLQQARLLKTLDLQVVRFQWVDKTDGSYFEFKIQRDDLTNDISLIITDFADSVSERESSKLLWHSQIEKLMQVIGSIY